MAANGQKETQAPTEQGFRPEKLFDGILMTPFVTQEALDAIRNYDIKDDDVWVVTYPKSGTNWVCEIVRLIHANGQADAIDRNQAITPIEFGTSIGGRDPLFKRFLTWKSPRVAMTHLREQMFPKQIYEGKGKAIYVIRNPKDVAVSLWHFIKALKFDPEYVEWNSFIQRYFKGEVGYGSWFAHNNEFWNKHRHDKNFLFVKYEDLKRDLRGGVVQMADFLGCHLSDAAVDLVVEHSSFSSMKKSKSEEETKKSFDATQKKDIAPKLMRKGVIGDWKTQFTVAQNEIYNKIYEDEMKESDLTVNFE